MAHTPKRVRQFHKRVAIIDKRYTTFIGNNAHAVTLGLPVPREPRIPDVVVNELFRKLKRDGYDLR